MGGEIRERIRERAGLRCEYCHLPDFAIDLPFHVEHIVASVHQPDDSMMNLAWACPRCNLRKGTNLTTVDPESACRVDLYNPRTMNWVEHFEIREAHIIGRTACGRGTVRLLDMNNESRIAHRLQLIQQGEF